MLTDKFPAIWQPDAANEDLRVLLVHRAKQVQLRTRLKNQLDGLAKSEGYLSPRVWSAGRREQLKALPLTGWQQRRRTELLELHDELDRRIAPLDEGAARGGRGRPGGTAFDDPSKSVGPAVSTVFRAGDRRCETV